MLVYGRLCDDTIAKTNIGTGLEWVRDSIDVGCLSIEPGNVYTHEGPLGLSIGSRKW